MRNAEGLGSRLEHDLTSAQFTAKFEAYRGTFRMLGVTSVRTSAGQRYSGIWVENRNGRGWSEYRDMTAQSFANRWNRAYDEGYRPVAFDRYETSSGTRYAGVWRQNTERPSWAPRGQVDARVQNELTDTAVPGISVAVFQRGQVRYMRGFGHTDIDDNVWMDSRQVGSLASVSKASLWPGHARSPEPERHRVRRMRWYTTGNREVAFQNNDWKVLGGGLDSSAYDLARFGDMLARGAILTSASRTTMWTPPDSTPYAYGWDTGSQQDSISLSHRVVAKGGSWTGALTHLRVYPDDGIVVAVMMNDRSQETGKPLQNPTALTRDIGALVLNSLP